ncbi:hypothetical protein [Streptomyces sp. 4N124]|uniref:hypothetical protein n=1 Tax=Streptomyces sp. 4N124 TaxID=3457420 RepID=UPI003FD45D24
MGRDSWFEETMAFYDQYLTGKKPAKTCPAYAVQTGAWRSQKAWPAADKHVTSASAAATWTMGGASEDRPQGSAGEHPSEAAEEGRTMSS